ncbi:MAG: hypothetical protein EA412_10760 [Chitinophagaceae bacterium]|nr:MAG: hypothetical protein EA412_10760 [Chitinophagaceae bacterium]
MIHVYYCNFSAILKFRFIFVLIFIILLLIHKQMSSFKELSQNPWFRMFSFLALLLLPYLFWQLILLFGENGGFFHSKFGIDISTDNFFGSFWKKTTLLIGTFFVNISVPLVHLFGYTTFSYDNVIGLEGHVGWLVTRDCLGIGSFVIFLSLILAYPAPMKLKAIFGVAGFFMILFLNVLRIVLLTIGEKDFPDSLDFLHYNAFRVIVFGAIFLTWGLFFYMIKKYEKA